MLLQVFKNILLIISVKNIFYTQLSIGILTQLKYLEDSGCIEMHNTVYFGHI